MNVANHLIITLAVVVMYFTPLAFCSPNQSGEKPEVHGIYQENSTLLFSLYSTKTGKSAWLEIGQQFNGWVLVDYDAGKQSLTVSNKSEVIKLPLSAFAVRHVTGKDVLPRDKALLELKKMVAGVSNPEFIATMKIVSYEPPPPAGSALAHLSDRELADLAKSAQQSDHVQVSDKMHLYFSVSRDALPIEISANLTDEDIKQFQKDMAEAHAANNGLMLKKLHELSNNPK